MLSTPADYNLSFMKLVYASKSRPYIKLLRFIASKVEITVKSQSTQCDLVSEGQQEKLNILQLSETVGYKGEGRKQFFMDLDFSKDSPSFLPMKSTLESE
jgi:hypothetical protein